MYPWISRTLDFGLQFWEKKCGLYMDVYGSDGSSIKDVYDGNLYKMFSGPGGFLASATNISLLGNTDGVALIRSSSYGVWPVFLVINELSPLQR